MHHRNSISHNDANEKHVNLNSFQHCCAENYHMSVQVVRVRMVHAFWGRRFETRKGGNEVLGGVTTMRDERRAHSPFPTDRVSPPTQ